ncbi:MAG: hotdog fold thioesterase [Chloroflexota bacterium]|nr:hotdog fold thioesterase [Chloroflexota bacterium]
MTDRQGRILERIQSDAYTSFLGAMVEEVAPGYSRVSLRVTDEMLNFHGITHGGLVFSLGDIAFAAASNSRGQTAVALNVAVSFMRSAASGDELVAEAQERDVNGPIGLYDITVTERGSGAVVAQSQATVYRKREWFVPEEA